MLNETDIIPWVQPVERYSVKRTGERRPICPLVRWLVWHRDGGRCKFCGSTDRTEIDHLIPWSANGNDRSTNLRLLCHDCNQERSNFKLWEWPRLIAVAHSCDDCIRGLTFLPYRHQSQLLHEHWCQTCISALGRGSADLDCSPAQPVFCGHCLAMSTATNELRVF